MDTKQQPKADKMIRIDADIDRFIRAKMGRRDTYADVLRRELGIDEQGRREESRRDRRRAS